MGFNTTVKHHIDTGDHQPIAVRNHITSKKQNEVIAKEIDTMLQSRSL